MLALDLESNRKETCVVFSREVLEGPDSPAEEALRGGSREAPRAAHAGLPKLQVPTSPEEAAEAHLQACGPGLPPGGAGP